MTLITNCQYWLTFQSVSGYKEVKCDQSPKVDDYCPITLHYLACQELKSSHFENVEK